MAKYKLVVSGWEIETSAHHITLEQYEKINNHKEKNEISTFHDMAFDFEDFIDGYYRYHGNLFNFSGAFAYDEQTYLGIVNESGEEIFGFVLGDINHVNSENGVYDAYPENTGHDCIIFAIDENKGYLYECEFESEEEPKIEDFTYSINYIDTPEREIDIIEDFYFKGQKLEKDFDRCDTSGKSSETDIYLK